MPHQPEADASESPPMKLNTIEVEGKIYAEVQDGKPLYTDDKGAAVAFDVVATTANLTALRGEAMRHRQEKEDAQKALKAFEGITDPTAALKALETVANLDQKKLIDAGEVERVKTEIAKGYETKLTEAEKKAKDLETALYGEKIGGAFARSPLIVGEKAKLAIPADLVQARFGQHFKIEDGKAVAYDAVGNRIYSRANPSELASFDEALEIIVDAYPHKDSILKGTGAAGSGAQGGGGGGGSKTMKASDFAALGPKEQAAKMAEGIQLID
ncbi:hypothetical protein [Synechococcus phage Yong-M4-211]|nr:hypothetical protein [Synechococcus phage Yong-M4-211]